MATTNLAIMMPKSMTFKAGAGTGVHDCDGRRGWRGPGVCGAQCGAVGAAGVHGERDGRAAAGIGRDAGRQRGDRSTRPAGCERMSDPSKDTRPGGGLGVPVDKDAERDPWTKYRWWIVGGLGLALAAAAGFVMKAPGPKPIGTARLRELERLEFAPRCGRECAAGVARRDVRGRDGSAGRPTKRARIWPAEDGVSTLCCGAR